MSLKYMGIPDRCPHGEYADKPCDKCEIERLRARLARVAQWAYCRSSVDRGWQPYFELDSNIDQILRPYLDEAAQAAGGDDE